ncbi:hypothetical protein [Kitasatospora purpeofusca]|uniref:Uncharacterized protein n=1 Tax=Kitasatospora purpeofusca TaxID=67352 RepID=A0ABZ1TXD9_9ACTN|nr:hypothetical protein [Kitasatospora purpeofusca]
MDPVAVGLLTELAAGVGGDGGRQAWEALGALVRRPTGVGSGEAELVALERAPGDVARAHALSTALAVRAALQPEFGAELLRWQEQARSFRTGEGSVRNEISGGTFDGTVSIHQGRDFYIGPDQRQ